MANNSKIVGRASPTFTYVQNYLLFISSRSSKRVGAFRRLPGTNWKCNFAQFAMFGDTQRSVFLLKKNQAFWPHSQTHTDLLSNPVSKSNLQFSAIRNVRFFSSKKVKAAGLIPKHIQSCLPILFRNLTLAQTTTQREKNTFVLLEIFGQTDRRTDRRTN